MLKAEFHLHTRASIDSRMDADTVIRSCLRRGVSCLFVTDHNQVWMAQELQSRAPFKVIVGEEITTSEGEIIGYFLKERVAPYQSPEDTIKEIRQQGGVVSVPHPFDRLRHARILFPALQRIIGLVDMIEVFNARNVFSHDDDLARAYAKKHNKFMIVASDAHTRWEVGRSYVELPDFSSPDELLQSLQSATLRSRRSPLIVHASTTFNKIRTRLFGNVAP